MRRRMKNGQKYAKEIQKLLNEECYECSLWCVRNGKKSSEDCCHISESFDPISGSDEFCDECLLDSLKWLDSEYKEPILTDEEKVIIKSIVNTLEHFECVPFNVELDKDAYGDYIRVWYKNIHGSVNALNIPNFDHTYMFKGIEEGNHYTLEELGL